MRHTGRLILRDARGHLYVDDFAHFRHAMLTSNARNCLWRLFEALHLDRNDLTHEEVQGIRVTLKALQLDRPEMIAYVQVQDAVRIFRSMDKVHNRRAAALASVRSCVRDERSGNTIHDFDIQMSKLRVREAEFNTAARELSNAKYPDIRQIQATERTLQKQIQSLPAQTALTSAQLQYAVVVKRAQFAQSDLLEPFVLDEGPAVDFAFNAQKRRSSAPGSIQAAAYNRDPVYDIPSVRKCNQREI